MDQKDSGALIVDSGSVMCKAIFAGFYASLRAPFGCRQPPGMSYGPEAQLCAWLVLLVTMPFVLCSRSLSSGPRCSAAWPVGLYLEMTSYVPVFTSLVRQWMHISVRLQRPGPELQKTAECPQLQFIAGHRHPVHAAEAGPVVQTILQTTEIPSLLFDFRLLMSSLCGSCRFSGAAVETFLALPQLHL